MFRWDEMATGMVLWIIFHYLCCGYIEKYMILNQLDFILMIHKVE
jgi:hypothetical protein